MLKPLRGKKSRTLGVARQGETAARVKPRDRSQKEKYHMGGNTRSWLWGVPANKGKWGLRGIAKDHREKLFGHGKGEGQTSEVETGGSRV